MLYSGFNSIYVRMCENDNCLIGHDSFGNTIIKLYISTVRALFFIHRLQFFNWVHRIKMNI